MYQQITRLTTYKEEHIIIVQLRTNLNRGETKWKIFVKA